MSHVDRDLLDACVHCGLCLPACPTYDDGGNELDSPRGRIALVRALAEGRTDDVETVGRHLDRCLGCRACETACPSGVRYGAILEAGRARVAARPRGVAALLLRAVGSSAGTVALMRTAWAARRTGLLALGRGLGGALGAAARIAPDAHWRPWSRTVARVLPATGGRRGAVALLPGCVMDQGFAREHDATAGLLRAAGFDVHIPRGPLCCGALHAHTGDHATAARIGARLRAAVADLPVDALVTNAAGCGSHLEGAAGPLAGRTFDVLEWLDRNGLGFEPCGIATRFGGGDRLRVAWDDPCHLLHGQGVHAAPRRLLASIPDVELVDLPEADRCCGSAGIYNLTQPASAAAQLQRKIDCVRGVAPDVLVTANPGCQLQLAAGLRDAEIAIPVVHAVVLLAASVRLPTSPTG